MIGTTLRVKPLVLIFAAICGIGCKKDGSSSPTKERVVVTHSMGLCNLTVFVTAEEHTAEDFGAEVELKFIPNWGDHAAAVVSGGVDASVTPFTNVLTAYANGAPVRIIAGAGMNGLVLLGRPGVERIQDLRGKKIGTFRADTLEVMAVDALRSAGMSRGDVEWVYFNDAFEIMQAYASGTIDAMTHVEPYVTSALNRTGGRVLAKGEEVWGGNHPDCVLTTSVSAIRNRRGLLKALIAGMLKAEVLIEQNIPGLIEKCAQKYYKAGVDEILMASRSQFAGVDIRDKVGFLLARGKTLKEMGYVSKEIDHAVVDFTLLDEVIREFPALWQTVKVKAAR